MHRRESATRTHLPVPGSALAAIGTAIGAFGVVYGAAAVPVLGVPATIASSALVFSGAAQFAMIGLLASGAGTAATLGTVAILAARHLPFGAILRPRLPGLSRWSRAGLGWFLIDEAAGLALAQRPIATGFSRSAGAPEPWTGAPEPSTDAPEATSDRARQARATARALLVAGGTGYGAFLVGTVVGTFGAQLPGIEPIAAAMFPVLFVGLAAVLCRTGSDAVRALGAAAVVAVTVWTIPTAGGFAPLLAAGLVASIGGRA